MSDDQRLLEFQKFSAELNEQLEDVDLTQRHPDIGRSKEDLVGYVSTDVFTKVLMKYDAQQKDPALCDKPVTCDDIAGKNMLNHLHSKVGFYNLGSTSRLVNSLRIRDPHRYSFLNGVSNMKPRRDESLRDLRHSAKFNTLKDLKAQARFKIESNQDPGETLKEAFSLLPDGDVELLQLRGLWYKKQGLHEQALSDFIKSDQLGAVDDDTRVKRLRLIAETHYDIGCKQYSCSDPQKLNIGIHHLEQALRMFPHDNSFQFQYNLLKERIETNKRGWGLNQSGWRK